MTTDDYILLVYKQLEGEISPAEADALAAWRAADPDHELDAQAIELAWRKTAPPTLSGTPDLDAAFAELEAKMPNTAAPKTDARIRQLPTRRWWAVAAGILFLVAAGWWGLRSTGGGTTPAAEWQTIAANEAVRTITLPDGSTVSLQRHSSLRYPAVFPKDERRVELQGEGFFEVQKQPEQPFIVSTAAENIKVLGTSFLVKETSADQTTLVYVASGVVAVESKTSDAALQLTVGEAAVSNAQDGTVRPAPEADANSFAWQSGLLRFEQTPLRVAIQKIQETFGYTIELTDSALAACTIDSQFDQSNPQRFAEEVATIFGARAKKTGPTTFKIMGGSCE